MVVRADLTAWPALIPGVLPPVGFPMSYKITFQPSTSPPAPHPQPHPQESQPLTCPQGPSLRIPAALATALTAGGGGAGPPARGSWAPLLHRPWLVGSFCCSRDRQAFPAQAPEPEKWPLPNTHTEDGPSQLLTAPRGTAESWELGGSASYDGLVPRVHPKGGRVLPHFLPA